jgi:hypothetical protein
MPILSALRHPADCHLAGHARVNRLRERDVVAVRVGDHEGLMFDYCRVNVSWLPAGGCKPRPSQDVKTMPSVPDIVPLPTATDPAPVATQLAEPGTLPGGAVYASDSWLPERTPMRVPLKTRFVTAGELDTVAGPETMLAR